MDKTERNQLKLEENVLNNSDLILNVEKPVSSVPWKDSLKQILACCIAHSLVIQAGINMSFSAILLPQLDEKKSSIHISKSEASWIGKLLQAVTTTYTYEKCFSEYCCYCASLRLFHYWTSDG
jgi:hypothetical protein